MAITPFSAVPSRATGQDTFSADVETFWGQLPTFVNEVNAFGAGLSSQITTSSNTSLLVGTGYKTLTVGTGLGFQVGYPVRIAYSDSIHMTGTVTSYNPTTGELICNITSSTGSGTYAVWAVYAIPASITNVPDGDKGDITVSASGSTWTIDNNAVTTAKILDANVTSAKLTAEAKTSKIQPITASVASNALTITLNPTVLDFRSSTLSSGAVNTRAINSAISLTISSGSTLGTANNVAARLLVIAIDNAGTVELAIANNAGQPYLDETGLISTTAEGGAGAADSATVIYSTTARSNVPYRVVGYIDITQATAGTWASAPTVIQGYGGNATPIVQNIRQGVAVTSSGATAYDFTIPTGVKRVNIYGITVSTSGSNIPTVQIGAGTPQTTGYLSTGGQINNGGQGAVVSSTVGFILFGTNAADSRSFDMTITNVTGNVWIAKFSSYQTATLNAFGVGFVTLSGGLTVLRVVAGVADTFDGGTLNVTWEF